MWFPYFQVEVFGSFRTGLYLPTSDIDVSNPVDVELNLLFELGHVWINNLSKLISARHLEILVEYKLFL